MSKIWDELLQQFLKVSLIKKELLVANFELTARCNLQCKMCYVCRPANDKLAKDKELTTAQWIRLAEEARDAGLLFLTLTGGEVFLRKDFKTIYEKLTRLGFIIKIYTNGTLMTRDIINWLATIPPKEVSITLYGTSRDTYQKVTGYAEGFDKTVQAIDTLHAKGIRTEIKTTVIHGNMHEYKQFIDFAGQRESRIGVVNYVSPRREGCHSDPLGNRLSPQELFQYERIITKYHQQVSVEKDEIFPIIRNNNDDLAKKDDELLKKIDPTDAFRCLGGKSAAWVTWDGRLISCALMEIPETNPLEKGFLAAWEELKHKCTLIPVSKECRECQYQSYCDYCPAKLYKETGYYDQPAPYLCELARSRAEYAVQFGNQKIKELEYNSNVV
jgi:radical SAM protein with 4Fe4S-binding SPASM domain